MPAGDITRLAVGYKPGTPPPGSGGVMVNQQTYYIDRRSR